jgi:DNA polymerase (family 10)
MSHGHDSLAALFRELTELTVLDEGSPNAFRARAYEKAMEVVTSHRGELASLTEKQLTALDGIGPSTAKKIREFFEKGTIAKLEELRQKYPPEFVELGKIPGLGPKTLVRLRSELGVRNLQDLRAALEGQKVRGISGLGEKLEQKLLAATARMGETGKDKRRPIAEAMPIARELVQALEALPAVERARYCGSLRRLRETVADVDIVAASREPSAVRDAFTKLPMVRDVIGSGETKTSVLTAIGLGVVIVGVYIVSNVWKEPLYDVMLAWDPEDMPTDWRAGRRRYFVINWIQAAATWTVFALFLVALIAASESR